MRGYELTNYDVKFECNMAADNHVQAVAMLVALLLRHLYDGEAFTPIFNVTDPTGLTIPYEVDFRKYVKSLPEPCFDLNSPVEERLDFIRVRMCEPLNKLLTATNPKQKYIATLDDLAWIEGELEKEWDEATPLEWTQTAFKLLELREQHEAGKAKRN